MKPIRRNMRLLAPGGWGKTMKIHSLLFVLVIAIGGTGLAAAELTPKALAEGLQKQPGVFKKFGSEEPGARVDFNIKLSDATVTVDGEFVFGGLRITAPKEVGKLDFVWYLNIPGDWGNWYICPVKGKAEEGFKDWHEADKVYQKLDDLQETGRSRVLQTLDGSYFRPGEEYILWFRKTGKGNDAVLRGRFCFAGRNKTWDHDLIEKALALEPMGPEAQVKILGSRGGKILLDETLFDRKYAAGRIDHVFFSLRHTRRMGGGFFITTEIACPPCARGPSYDTLRGKYGVADFVQSAEEKRWTRSGGKEDSDKKEDGSIVTYYYDYFGFEVSRDDKDHKVLRVVAQANDFSTLRPKDDGARFGRIGMRNLTVFYKDWKEVGRLYFFLEGGKQPICVQEPPAGKYRDGDEELEYLGGGKWIWRTRNDSGVILRKIPFSNHQMEGVAEGYYPDKTPSFKATYRKGVLHGDVIEYSPKGDVTRKRTFRDGEPQ